MTVIVVVGTQRLRLGEIIRRSKFSFKIGAYTDRSLIAFETRPLSPPGRRKHAPRRRLTLCIRIRRVGI